MLFFRFIITHNWMQSSDCNENLPLFFICNELPSDDVIKSSCYSQVTIWKFNSKVTIIVELWQFIKWRCNYAVFSQRTYTFGDSTVKSIRSLLCDSILILIGRTLRKPLSQWLRSSYHIKVTWESQCYIFVTSNNDVSKSRKHLQTSPYDGHLRVVSEENKSFDILIPCKDCNARDLSWSTGDSTFVSECLFTRLDIGCEIFLVIDIGHYMDVKMSKL